MKLNRKKINIIMVFSYVISLISFQAVSIEIIGGGGHAAEILLLDWSQNKLEGRPNIIKFSQSILSNDLNMLQSKKIDFAIVDSPLTDAELTKRNLIQIPFVLSGTSIVINQQQSVAGTLKLDSQTVGKIFSGEITQWDDPEIIALNPKHEFPNKPIIIIHSGDSSSDYSVFNSYIGSINDKWKTDEVAGKPRAWPSNSVYTDSITARSAAIKNTAFSISYLPMQYISTTALSPVHIKNKDGKFLGLSDTTIISSASTVNIEDNLAANLTLINKSGSGSWPISNFEFIVVNKDNIKDDKIVQLFNILASGLKFGSVKPTLYNFVPLPEQSSKSILSRIESITGGLSKGYSKTSSSTLGKIDDTQEQAINKKRVDEDLSDKKAKQRTEPSTTQDLIRQNEIRKAEDKARVEERARADERFRAEERARATKFQQEEAARNEAIKEAKVAKIAAEETIRAAKAAKIAADEIIEKNNLIAKASKEKAEREKAIEMRNQKDEDPLTAYRRSIQ